MIIQSDDERNALLLILALAGAYCSRRGCDDLTPEQKKLFGHLTIKVMNKGVDVDAPCKSCYDVVTWLLENMK